MYKRKIFLFIFLIISISVFAQTTNSKADKKESNLNQYYSGKVGFYNPGNGLNNGLILGVDGITEFKKYNFFLSGDIDLYQKKTIDIFSDPKPNISDQLIFLIPLHVNFGYKLAEVADADTKFYAGLGGGYYLYFYSVSYSGNSGGLFGGLTTNSDSKSGGNIFFSIFGRILIGKIFIEPRYYIASKKSDNTGGYTFNINPSGFSISLGFQY